MNNILESIREPIEADLQSYDDYIRRAMRSDQQAMTDITDYILYNRGKGIRPMLVMLMAGIHSPYGTVGRRSYLASMLVEMIHTASLVHDDVIDTASIRHGKPSVNSVWGANISVIVGDYILARAFTSGMQSGQYDLVSYVVDGIADLCEGEVMQDKLSKTLEMTRETYYQIIGRKTAVLLGISCGAGALSSGADRTAVALARQVGLDLGMAFQIKDDVLDYAPSSQTGKPTAADLREHKITLPVLMLLEQSSPEEQQRIRAMIAEADHNPDSVDQICRMVSQGGYFDRSMEQMQSFLDRARHAVGQYPDTPFRRSLLLLCDFIVNRNS